MIFLKNINYTASRKDVAEEQTRNKGCLHRSLLQNRLESLPCCRLQIYWQHEGKLPTFAFSQRQQFREGRQTQVELVWLPQGSPTLNVFSHYAEFIVQLRIVSAKAI